MLYALALWLTRFNPHFVVFHYLTLRAILSCLTALLLTIWCGPWTIRFLQKLSFGQVIRKEGPASHQKKSGTPTMGGLLIISAILISTLLWCDLSNRYVWVVGLTTLAYAIIGFLDDYLKIVKKHSDGLIPRYKFLLQSIVALIVGFYLFYTASEPVQLDLFIPFIKTAVIYLGPAFVVLVYFVIVGFGNAVNLTDGLDGLAIFPVVLVAAALGVFIYVTGNIKLASYLYMPYIDGSGELVNIAAAMVGAGLGFLWFNAYPAEVFMGDVGSLALGAALSTMAVIIGQEIVLCIMGGIFVLEAVSVILQVASYKTRKKRIFKMAPIHHHFELKGWAEPRVIVRFWIITFVLVLIGLSALKIR